jgi:hypothetical protein
MRKAFLIVLSLCLVVTAAILHGDSTTAQTATEGQLKPGADEQVLHDVSFDCLAVKFKLSKIHEDDGLSRVNIGQSYDLVSSKLMARLNSRIVQSRLDGAELIKKASEYETALNDFKNDYQTYEVQMNNLIKADCSTQPQSFYGNLQTVRDLRAKVENDTKQLNRLIKEYRAAFEVFYSQHLHDEDKKGA